MTIEEDRLKKPLKVAGDMEKGREMAGKLGAAIIKSPGNKKTTAALEKLQARSDAPATFAKAYLQAAFAAAGLTLEKVAQTLAKMIDGKEGAQPKDRLQGVKLALQASNIIGASGDQNATKGGLNLGTLGDDELIEIVQTVRKRKAPQPVDANYKVLDDDGDSA